MELADFDYDLPKELIAQEPLKIRDEAKLMVVKRQKIEDKFEHRTFQDLAEYLNPGDTLVLNDTKVLPARLFGNKKGSGGKVELLLLKELEKDTWEVLVRGRRIRAGTRLTFGEGKLEGEVKDRTLSGGRKVKFFYQGKFLEILKELGQLPLPPYIHQELKDENYYQTIYAQNEGSAAAPTAGLHITTHLLEDIRSKGVNIAYLTLHINLDTFRPIRCKDISSHQMFSEYYEISDKTARIIKETKRRGKRIIALGTTTVRALESAAGATNTSTVITGLIRPKPFGFVCPTPTMSHEPSATSHEPSAMSQKGWTNLFIYPDYRFKIVDVLVTNFHFPKSTLLTLVCAFASRDLIFKAYGEAIKMGYRFLSLGDSMLII